jgi:hypothetical protein
MAEVGPSAGVWGCRRSRHHQLREHIHGPSARGTIDNQPLVASSRPRVKSILVRAGDGPRFMVLWLPRRSAGVAVGARGLSWFMACRFGEPTTACRLNEFWHNDGSGPGCPATTLSHRRMCTGGRTSSSETSQSCGGLPNRVKSLRHQGRAPRPWCAFTV